MRKLLQYAMLGRLRIIIVVLLCGFFPLLYFISAALVGLVNLRYGPREGLLMLLWAMLPASMWWVGGDIMPALLMVGVAALSQALRSRKSWPQVILLAVLLGLAAQYSLNWQPGYVERLETVIAGVMEGQYGQELAGEYTPEQVLDLLLSLYGAYNAGVIVLCLMLARWWQAILYNPGGFQQEFHNLRFDPRHIALLLALILAGLFGVAPLDEGVAVFCLPALFNGMAVLHGIVERKNMGNIWLGLCYMALLMLPPTMVVLGMIDSVVDIRRRVMWNEENGGKDASL